MSIFKALIIGGVAIVGYELYLRPKNKREQLLNRSKQLIDEAYKKYGNGEQESLVASNQIKMDLENLPEDQLQNLNKLLEDVLSGGASPESIMKGFEELINKGFAQHFPIHKYSNFS